MEDRGTFYSNHNGYCLKFETFRNQSRDCTDKHSVSPSFSISDTLHQRIPGFVFYKKRNKFTQISLWHTHTDNIYLICFMLKLWFEAAMSTLSYKITRNYIVIIIYGESSSLPEVFLGKGVLKICSKFTGEHPCKATLLKSHFGMCTYRTPLDGWFYIYIYENKDVSTYKRAALYWNVSGWRMSRIIL